MNISTKKHYLFVRKKDLRVYILSSNYIYPKNLPVNRVIEIQNYIETKKDGVKPVSVEAFNKLGLKYIGII